MIFDFTRKAKEIFYDNKVSGLHGNNVQAAIDRLRGMLYETDTKVDEIANNQIPEEYLEAAVDEYVNNNSGGFATQDNLEEVASQLSLEIANGFNSYTQPSCELYGKTITYDYSEFKKESGFISHNGSVVALEGFDYKHFFIPSTAIKRITINKGSEKLGATNIYYAVYVGNDGTVAPVVNEETTGASGEIAVNANGVIYLNVFGNGYATSCTVEYYTESDYKKYVETDNFNALQEVVNTLVFPYKTVVHKPFEFNGKKALFVGDSITYGTSTDYTRAEKPYPQIFAESVGMSHDNLAIAGSAFSSGYNEIETIESVLSNANFSQYDYIFIAGGVNDWQLGVPLGEYRTNLRRICQSLSARKDANKIVFITPINVNEAWSDRSSVIADLDTYSLIIAEEAMIEGINVVIGRFFNFPQGAGSLATTLFADGLHLTQKGLYLYAKSLMTELC